MAKINKKKNQNEIIEELDGYEKNGCRDGAARRRGRRRATMGSDQNPELTLGYSHFDRLLK